MEHYALQQTGRELAFFEGLDFDHNYCEVARLLMMHRFGICHFSVGLPLPNRQESSQEKVVKDWCQSVVHLSCLQQKDFHTVESCHPGEAGDHKLL